MLVNNYSPEKTFAVFPDLDARLHQHYDYVSLDVEIPKSTPRYRYESGLKIGFRDIFWYIDRLYTCEPDSVVDIGCGENIFANWFPGIIGVDTEEWPGGTVDDIAYFDTDYADINENFWDAGMALGSLHYCDWQSLPKQIHNAMRVVKRDFLFTFNFDQMQNLPSDNLDIVLTKFYNTVAQSGYKLKMFDCPKLRGHDWHGRGYFNCNGSVRFILGH